MEGQQLEDDQVPEEYKAYTLNEVSKILKASKRTLYRMIESGELKAIKVGDKRNWLVKKETLDAIFNGDKMAGSGENDK